MKLDLAPFSTYTAKQAQLDQAWSLCESRLRGLPPPLDELAARFLSSISGETTHRAYFSSPIAPPLLYMPLWLDDALGGLSEGAIAPILAASMLGYFHVRIQDDLLDDPTRADPELALLGNACLSGMITMYQDALGAASARFFAAFDRAFLDFSRHTLAEQRVVRGADPYTADDFEAHADKVAFARVPLLAVAAKADRFELERPIATLVHRLGIAYGLANDVLGWSRDIRAGHRTYLLAEAGLTRAELDRVATLGQGPDADAEAIVEKLRKTLYEGGLLHATTLRAIDAHRSAAEAGRDLGLASFDAFTEERIAWLSSLDRQILALTLRRALSSPRAQTDKPQP